MRNLTEVSLKNKGLVWYFIVVIFLAGIFCYFKLGRMEDPQFTVRQMVASVAWPGATAAQVEEQVTDKLEKKIQDTPGLDYVESESRPGQAVIYVNLRQDLPKADIRPTWRDVRNFCEDIKKDLPDGVYGPDTEQAVQALQRKAGLPVTGVINAETWNRMALLYNFISKVRFDAQIHEGEV